jgi:hypothetical protein
VDNYVKSIISSPLEVQILSFIHESKHQTSEKLLGGHFDNENDVNFTTGLGKSG